MILYLHAGQRINKSVQEEHKIWVLVVEAYSYVVQFRPYQGAKKGKQVASSTRWGLGENVVLRLMEFLTPTVNFNIFMDNYFTFHLGVNSIWATGVFNRNRMQMHCHREKQLQKKERNHFEQHISNEKAVQLWQWFVRTAAGNLRTRLKESIFKNNN